jgi:hypothetical protein
MPKWSWTNHAAHRFPNATPGQLVGAWRQRQQVEIYLHSPSRPVGLKERFVPARSSRVACLLQLLLPFVGTLPTLTAETPPDVV